MLREARVFHVFSRSICNLNSMAEHHRVDRQVLIDVNILDTGRIKGFSIDKPHSFTFLGNDFALSMTRWQIPAYQATAYIYMYISHYNNSITPRASM